MLWNVNCFMLDEVVEDLMGDRIVFLEETDCNQKRGAQLWGSSRDFRNPTRRSSLLSDHHHVQQACIRMGIHGCATCRNVARKRQLIWTHIL
jgi:hypothetical protein